MLMRTQSSLHRWIYTAAQSQTKAAGVSARPVRVRACWHLSAFVSVWLCHFYFLFMLSLSRSDLSSSDMLLPFALLPISGPSGALLRGQLYLEVAVSRGSCCARRLQQHLRTKEVPQTGVSTYLLGLECSQGTWCENICLWSAMKVKQPCMLGITITFSISLMLI